jgi:hypothetical protein
MIGAPGIPTFPHVPFTRYAPANGALAAFELMVYVLVFNTYSFSSFSVSAVPAVGGLRDGIANKRRKKAVCKSRNNLLWNQVILPDLLTSSFFRHIPSLKKAIIVR